MGCWNGTCGLTNLHITAGQDVVVFAMEQKHGGKDLCYTTPFYAPVTMPFYAKYNDYGGAEECEGFGLSIVMDAIKENLVELPQGENQFHDIAVKKEEFNDKLFFEAIHEDRLFIGGLMNKRQRIHTKFVMFHKGVWDNIFENRVIEKYVGEGKGTGGWGNNYVFYKFADIVAGIPEVVDHIMKVSHGDKDGGISLYYSVDPLSSLRKLEKDSESLNPAISWLGYSESYRNSRLVNISSLVYEYAQAHDAIGLTQLLIEFLKFRYIDSYMLETRKFWSPQAGAGSQNQEHEPYRLLIESMTKVLDAEKAEYAEMYED